jgi:hypothetical protein
VPDTFYTRALAQAIEVEGGPQALAYLLRVPESTLLRWVAGRAQMPLQAFHRVIELLIAHERKSGEARNIGHFPAECRRCGGTQFEPAAGQGPLGMTSVLVCSACKAETTQGELLAELATQAVRTAAGSASTTRGRRLPSG